MASYLSYFTSNTTSQPYQQQQYGYGQAASAASTWANTFSSRIATLRKALTKDNEEDDPDNEDCSHVSNVLRAYYTEKGRPFPEWLPPDPKKPAISTAPPPAQYGQYGGGYGGDQYGGSITHGRGGPSGRSGLSDLWDSGPAQTPPPPAQSLRAQRPTPQSLRSFDSSARQSSNESNSLQSTARPLPSQRTGSYQNNVAAQSPAPTAANPPVVGSRDRLRARLQGGGSGRSSPANAASSNHQASYNASDSYQGRGQYGANADYDPYRTRPGGPR